MLSINFALLKTAQLSWRDKKSLLVIFASTYLDMYDFALFVGYSIYLSPLILPKSTAFDALLILSLVLVCGQAAKLLGIYLFYCFLSSYHNNIRLAPLAIGLAYLALAFLPGHSVAGISPLWLLILIRTLQGIAFGYEMGFSICHANLAFTPHKRSHIYFFILLSGELGMVLSVFINRLIVSNGIGLVVFEHVWRMQFLLGVVLIVINLCFRQSYVRKINQVSNFSRLIFFYTLKHELSIICLRAAIVFLQASLLIMAIFRMPSFLQRALGWSHPQINHLLLLITILGFAGSYSAKWLSLKIQPSRLMQFFYVAIIISNGIFLLNHGYHSYLVLWLYLLGFLYGFSLRLTPLVLYPIHDFHLRNRLTGRYLSYIIGFTFFGSLSLVSLDLSRYFTHNYSDFSPELLVIFAACLAYLALKIYNAKYKYA